jgi:hypothetical protein
MLTPEQDEHEITEGGEDKSREENSGLPATSSVLLLLRVSRV